MKALDTSPRVRRAYWRLRDDIELGRYPERSLLPPSRELCRHYQVSRPTLAKAVSQLVEEGRLQTRPGAGTVVLPPVAADTRIVSVMSITNDEVLMGLQRKALGLGWLLNIFLHQEVAWDPQTERRFLQCVKEQRSLALLAFCSPLAPTNDDLLAELAGAGIRVIHTEPYRVALPDQEYVMPDYRRAGHQAAVKLLLAGCRELRVTGHWEKPAPSTLQIEQGVADAIEDYVGAYDPAEARLPLMRADEYADGTVRRMLAELPDGTGVIYTRLNCAEQAVGFLREDGRSPEALRIVAVETLNHPQTSRVGRVVFHRPQMLEQALMAVQRPAEAPVRHLIRPEWISADGKEAP